MKARPTPSDFLRLYVIVSFVVIACAGLLFGLIADNVMSGGWLTIIDAHVAQWLHIRSTPAVTQSLLILTHLHDPIIISVVAILIATYLIWKNRLYKALSISLVVQGGMLLNLLAKHLFQRARPQFEQPLVVLTTYSFPSGHVVACTLFYGVLAALLVAQTSSRIKTTGILLTAFVMIILIAFSRLYLGAHYLSDVLAAFLEGVVWLTLCLIAIQTYRAYHKTNGLK